MYYKIITQSLLTRCQQSVFFLFFWLTHVISHRNIVLRSISRSPSFSRRVQISLSLSLSLCLSHSLSFALSLPLFLSISSILSFNRSPWFAPPLRSYRARENSKDAISASLKRHGGDNACILSPLLSSPFSLYTTAPLS